MKTNPELHLSPLHCAMCPYFDGQKCTAEGRYIQFLRACPMERITQEIKEEQS